MPGVALGLVGAGFAVAGLVGPPPTWAWGGLAVACWLVAAGQLVRVRDARLLGRYLAALTRQAAERDRAALALRESEERFRQLAENIDQVFYVARKTPWQVLYVSPAFQRIWGRPSQGVLADPQALLDSMHPEDRQAVDSSLAQHARGEPSDVEYRVVRPDGTVRWIRDRTFPLRDEAGVVHRVVGVAEDVTARKQTDDALRATTAYLRAVIDTQPECVKLVAADGTLLEMNAAGLALVEADSLARVQGRCVFDLIAPEHRDRYVAMHRCVCAGQSQSLVFEVLGLNGTRRWVESRAVPLSHTPSGSTVHLAITRDITERKRAEDELRQSREQYESLIGCVEGVVWEVDARTFHFRYVSPFAERLLGYPVERWYEPTFWVDHLHPDDRRWALDSCLAAARDARDHQMEYRMVAADGREVWLRDLVHVVVRDGRADLLRGLMVDVTERKHAEEQVLASLREKEALLKEVHHRVKNNLQIVSSLLSLQADRLSDPAARAVFAESQARVRAMALVHETLYRTDRFAAIDLPRYVETLCDQLVRVFGRAAQPVRLERRVAAVALDLDVALPCGLIINELVSNALKYAFPDGRPGRLLVAIDAGRDGRYTLTVSDDGVGLPEGGEPDGKQSLGLHLVGLLARQLRGTLEVRRSGGTTFAITFSSPAADGPPCPARES